jgi:dihydrofolate reductase
MTFTTAHMSISLDGFVAGPDQSRDDPLGVGGMQLHKWHFDPVEHEADIAMRDSLLRPRGAYVMGRNMFGPIRGEWRERDWRGWWGDDPPYHCDTFVLTHHPRESVEMQGGTTFHFVTDGIEAAMDQATAAAGERDISIAGGASTVRQYLSAGLLDELNLQINPILLGAGERPLDGLDSLPALELERTLASPAVTHVRYRVVKQ